MNNAAIPSVFDTQSLATLKSGLRKDDPQALKAAARQFEAVFLQMVLKSMRAATPQESMFDSEQTRFYQELLDSQLAQVMSAKGGTGLAAVIERQLSRTDSTPPEGDTAFPLSPAVPSRPLAPAKLKPLLAPEDPSFSLPGKGKDGLSFVPPATVSPAPTLPAPSLQAPSGGDTQAEAFSNALWPHAVSASRQTGIPPQFLLAQAALETGWGKAEPRLADGRQSFNLFGIKAGGNWNGPVAESNTTEFVNGKAVRRVERFRAYGSYAEAFDDYARLLTTQPRYAQVLGARDAASFARGLQNAGYATDPAYAGKLARVIGGLPVSMTMKGRLA